MHKLDALEIIS